MAIPRRSAVAGPSTSNTPSSSYADVSELDKYRLVSNIGKGSFGVISKVQRIEDGKEFALKQLDYSKMTDRDRKQILAEVAILESLKHRNIVQLIQKIKDPKNERIYIVMEFCTSGDLGTLIRKAQRSNQPLHEDKIWNIFLQITLALHHCHYPADRPAAGAKNGRPSGGSDKEREGGVPRYQVLHRDLKPENVFLSDDFVKLGDFGLSKDMGTAAFTSTYVGTPLYMPPEILAENKYDTKSDIWSLGCLVFEMCTLHSPFSTAQTQAELISMVKSGKLPSLPPHISPALKGIVKAMLNLNPVKRPSTKDLLEMDEMKLHRKLFTVQNHMSLLLSKKEELETYDKRLTARALSLDEREKALVAREASCAARESSCVAREDENRETQRKLNFAAETLRGQWDRLRGEKEKGRDGMVGLGLPGISLGEDSVNGRRSSTVPTRPPLEERNTVPLPAVSRFPRALQSAYEETPSKASYSIPPSPGALSHLTQARAATPLRKAATKSLGNLNERFRADATPAKQTIGFPKPVERQRTSIGSPSEIRGGGNWCEDVSMASPMSIAMASPFVPRPRKSSADPAAASRFSSTMTALQANGVVSSCPSESAIGSNEAIAEGGEASSHRAAASLPPTMIPAPSYAYREAATPAKWSAEDPDLPSPFLRRAPSAPLPASQQSIIPDRQPLGAISVQSSSGVGLGKAGGGMMGGGPSKMPRSKSGNLHQQVLSRNAVIAGRTSGEGGGGGSGAKAKAAAGDPQPVRRMMTS